MHCLSFIICGLSDECRETPALTLNFVLHMEVVNKALLSTQNGNLQQCTCLCSGPIYLIWSESGESGFLVRQCGNYISTLFEHMVSLKAC